MELQGMQKVHVIGNKVLDEYFYHTAGGACIGYDSRLHLYSFDGYVIISMATIMNDNTVHVHVRNQYVHVNGYLGILTETKALEHFCFVKHCALLMYFNLRLTLGSCPPSPTPAPARSSWQIEILLWNIISYIIAVLGQEGLLEPLQEGLQEHLQEGLLELLQEGQRVHLQEGLPEPLQEGLQVHLQEGVVEPLPGGIAGAPPGGIAGAPPGGIAGAPPGGIAGAPPGWIAGAPPGGIAGSPPGGRMGSSSLLSGSGLGDLLIL
uniref:Uncharacterized protein n=1 Tax=Amphimedon queenslandica TaxID=400682 RepID=A0A1X7VAI1_AMPQE